MRKIGAAGYTLVELLITFVVLGIVVAVVMNFMASSLVQSTLMSARADLLFDAQNALDSAQSDIRLSAAAESNNRWPDDNAPAAPSDRFSWTSTSNRLILATAAENSSGTILFEDAKKYITHKDNYIYFVQNGNLYKRIIAAPVAGNPTKTSCPAAKATAACPADKLLMHNVQSFLVTYLDANDLEVTPTNARAIELTVNLKIRKYQHDITATYTTRTVFRND